MRDYIRLSKLLLHMQFKPDKSGKGKKGNIIAFIILGAMFFMFISVGMIFLGGEIAAHGFVAEMSALIMDIGFIIVLIFGTLHILSYMFFSPDNEFLLSLPLKPGAVYAAKLTVVYAANALLAAVFVVPGLLFLGITASQGFLYYLMTLVAIAVVPVFPLLLASLLAIPLMYITSLFKHKGVITTVVLIAVFAGVMVGYMMLVTSFGTGAEANAGMGLDEIMRMLKDSATNMALVIYPFYSLGRFMTFTPGLSGDIGLSMLIDAGIFFGSLAVSAVLVVAFSSAFYRKSALRQLENPTKNNAIKKEHVESTAYSAMLKKEWRELIRNSSFAFQCLTGVIIVPVMSIMVSLLIGGVTLEGEVDEFIYMYMLIWITAQFMVQMMGVGMNFFSMTAITREGKSYEVSKTIPVPYSVQLRAKKTIGLLIMAVPIVISMIAMQVFQIVYGNYNPALLFFALPMLLIFGYGFTCYFLNRDLKKPNLHWSTPAEAVRNNKATLIPFLINMAVSFACTIVTVIFGVIGLALDIYIIMMIVGYLILIGGGIGFAIPMHRALNRNCEKYYTVLGDN